DGGEPTGAPRRRNVRGLLVHRVGTVLRRAQDEHLDRKSLLVEHDRAVALLDQHAGRRLHDEPHLGAARTALATLAARLVAGAAGRPPTSAAHAPAAPSTATPPAAAHTAPPLRTRRRLCPRRPRSLRPWFRAPAGAWRPSSVGPSRSSPRCSSIRRRA